MTILEFANEVLGILQGHKCFAFRYWVVSGLTEDGLTDWQRGPPQKITIRIYNWNLLHILIWGRTSNNFSAFDETMLIIFFCSLF